MKPLKATPNSVNSPRKIRLFAANDHGVETAFLPAALEVVETPPSPLGRALVYLLCALFVIALAWSYFGKVDLIATSQGKIIPGGKVKVIQPLEIGVVSKIDVHEGEKVKAGDVLVEIDPTESRAEEKRLAQELNDHEIEAARLEATRRAVGPGDAAEKDFLAHVPEGTDQETIARQRELLRSALTQQAAMVGGIDSDIAQKRAERRQTEAEIAKIEQTIPLVEKRSQIRDDLVAKGYSSVIEASREKQALIESRQTLTEDKHKLEQNAAALNQLLNQRAEADAKFQATTLSGLADAKSKADDARQQLIKAQTLASRRTLTAPVDGTVQQLAIHTVGGVVTPAQQLMVVVPQDAALEVEAMIQNKDIGFVREGQEAEIKLETFPFTRYGFRRGTVLQVSRDSVAPSPPLKNDGTDSDKQGAEQSTPTQDSLYTARISLDQDTMNIDGKVVPLSPGMTVTAEIKTGRQRVLDYLLDPLRRYRHDSFQER
jgi:hemolysin D